MKNKFFLLAAVLLVISLISCHHESSPDFEILSPVSDTKYFTDSMIVFSTNLNSENLIWSSSIDGELGSGPQLVKKLSEGNHKITLYHTQKQVCQTVEICVEKREKEKVLSYDLLQKENKIYTGSDSNRYKGIFTLEGNIQNLQINETDNENSEKEEASKLAKNCLKDFVLRKNDFCSIIQDCNLADDRQANIKERTFKVVNTITQTDCHEVTADLIFSDEVLDVYLDVSCQEQASIIECVKKFEETAYTKVTDIWGSCADIDKNGKFTLLFTPWLNNENVAVGFFNQNDFFAINEDKNSDEYNPFSNQMDICYVAIPDASNANYSYSSIIATIAHELTHAINFSIKVYEKFLAGQKDTEAMDVFLDEGLAHLTESLTGYGESGGNLKFVDKYINKSYQYSFCGTDIYGQSDSVYQRGAMTLFLYYLFSKKSGIEWSENSIVVNDGIKFLRKIVLSDNSSWNGIGEAFGSNTDTLFIDFCKEVFEKDMNEIFDFSITDPITSEKIFYCENIVPVDSTEKLDVISYSITKFPFTGSCDFSLNWEELSGTVYLAF